MARLSGEDLMQVETRLAQAAQELSLTTQTRTDIQSLLDEVHALREREAALLEIARAVAAMPHVARGGRSLCVACGRDAEHHRPDCFREKARKLLGLQAPPKAL